MPQVEGGKAGELTGHLAYHEDLSVLAADDNMADDALENFGWQVDQEEALIGCCCGRRVCRAAL